MNCIKCGRKLKDSQVFCPDCQEDMKNYPVKPGTPIQLPIQPKPVSAKKRGSRRKKLLKAEDQLLRMRSTIRWLTFTLAVSLLAFLVTAVLVLMLLDQRGGPVPEDQALGIVEQADVSRETYIL